MFAAVFLVKGILAGFDSEFAYPGNGIPGVDAKIGQDLAGQITTIYPDTRHLFMSGYTAEVIVHQGILDDGVAFIQKPFSMAGMTEKVRDVLDMASDEK